ncbi:hypothetical protein CkaCkLH20_00696 [Colletotrichum karsti]|uniref:Uncharacterized protein n=1 Tax=Colletotrichum karsti TaxID=1095194 RepID=A0A9P6LPZ4_9PEZI|nr:uncharacterized protein CkaCkLH20_00696 [Colletotrichum karsti]KAF9881550.1 hypothetical protein CkaCkLH20_00696 [Colletotrichum karsti]
MNFAGMLVKSAGYLVQELLWTFIKPQVSVEVPAGSGPDGLSPSPMPIIETYRHHSPKIPTWSWASMVLRHYETMCRPEEMYFPYRQVMGTWSKDESFRLERSKCAPRVGGRGDSFLAANWVLQVAGKMITAEFTGWQVMSAVDPAVGHPYLFKMLMSIHPVPALKPTYDGSFFQPDCSQWPKSLDAEDPLSKRVELLLLGRVQVAGTSAPPGCESESKYIDVGLVLRKSSRNYATNAYERLGTFVALAEHEMFEGCSVQDIALV